MNRQTLGMEMDGILNYPSLMGKKGRNRSANKKEHALELVKNVIGRAKVVRKGKKFPPWNRKSYTTEQSKASLQQQNKTVKQDSQP